MKYLTGILFLTSVSIVGTVSAQRPHRPNEFIEASSPIPGGGVVTSVYVPGGGGPIYQRGPDRQATPIREASLRQPAQSFYVQPANYNAGQTVFQVPPNAQMPVNQVPVVARVPSLGVPTNWNRSIRTANATGYGPGAGYVPYGMAGNTPAGSVSSPVTVAPQAVTTTQPQAIAVQNLPPNAYMGRGILGSTRQYTDGQPIRNLFRYVFP